MSKLGLTATLKGTGVINNAYIYLEDVPASNPLATAVGLFPQDTTNKIWINKKIKIEVEGNLEYQLNVHAFSGTDWEFELATQPAGKKVLSLNGTTGTQQSMGYGKNISIAKGTVVASSL